VAPRYLALSLLLVCFASSRTPAIAGAYCDDEAKQIVMSELLQAREGSVLTTCMNQGSSWAYYLRGLFPRFTRLSEAEREKSRGYLSQAAKDGYPRAQAVWGAYLLDHSENQIEAEKLIERSAISGDKWGIWLSSMLAIGADKPLNKTRIESIRPTSTKDFPFAYGIIAILSLSQAGDSVITDLVDTDLVDARNLARIGAALGDPSAFVVLAKEGEPSISESDLRAASQVLLMSAKDVDEDDAEAGFRAWNALVNSTESSIDEEAMGVIGMASKVCEDSKFSGVYKLCRMRSAMDHYMCLNPLADDKVVTVHSVRIWMMSAGYQQCRELRLEQSVTHLYYE
jgi:hypothetical protein